MGASSGIGRAIAETFASRGVKIGVGARRVADLEMLKAKYPGMIECEAIDVTVPEAKTGLARLIEKWVAWIYTYMYPASEVPTLI